MIRTGGRFVKNTSGYDLTQLIIGSEGTLALVTEATLRLHPRLQHTASILAPFATIEAVAEVIPRVVASGVQPMILEYIDRSTMKGLLRMNDLTLGIPTEIESATEAYLVVVLEGRTEDRLEHDVADVATQLAGAGAYDVYVLPPGQGADSARRARERVLDGQGGRRRRRDRHGGAAQSHPGVPAAGSATHERAWVAVFGCGHAGDGNIHFSVYEPDAERRSALLSAIFEMGMAMGGAISGEHGIGRTKKRYYQALEDPAKLALQRRIKTAFDPNGILNPGCIFD